MVIEETIQEIKENARQRQLDFKNQMKKSREELMKDLDKRFNKIKPEPVFDWKRRKSTL